MAPEASNHLLLVLGTQAHTKQENTLYTIHRILTTIPRLQ